MKSTKKLAISAMLTALGTVILTLGSLIDSFSLSVGAIASLIVVMIYIELGSPYTWLVWLCTSLASVLMPQAMTAGIAYFLVFGIFPILKAYFERLPRLAWLPVKILYINAVTLSLMLVMHLLGLPFFEGDNLVMNVAIYVLINIAFVVYDMFLTVMVRIYLVRFRPKFKRFFR